MKTRISVRKGNQVSLLLIAVFVLCSFATLAQAPPPLYAKITMFKVYAGKQLEFEKFMNETIKPTHVLRRQQGKIVMWILFRVHNTGELDEYNYAAVSYYPSWAATEPYNPADLLKQVNANADPVGVGARLRELRTVVRQHIIYRADVIEPNPPIPSKYVRLDYMKVKPGKNAAYLKLEREEWMPFHRRLLADGQITGWALWQMVLPGGSGLAYDYATSQRYGTYSQVMGVDYAATFKKVYPDKNVTDILTRTTDSRELVKSELWEVVDMLN